LEPEILLLDEPASGLSPTEVNELADMIFNIRQLGTAILLIEHRMELVMKCADRVIVLNFGKKIVEGQPEDIRRDARVIEAYLGKQTDVSENQETS
ncbi:ABC transporter ATP-binding protein, partial [Candidatus Bathyarchaeota archaeon]|nr:ABC transporter ATP-binding protein [Candidatus Bathyarchaeota archaeon]